MRVRQHGERHSEFGTPFVAKSATVEVFMRAKAHRRKDAMKPATEMKGTLKAIIIKLFTGARSIARG